MPLVVDSAGNPVRHQEYQLSYAFEGDIKLLGVDNGASDNVQRHQSDTLQTSQGRALAIVQSNLNAGDVKVMVSGDGLTPIEQTITIQ
ncbi:hypothetical protein FNC98_10235 [Thalassotalea sp. PS06]|nr:hypothetical protein [Thalassotalea sp. PS06]QDP01678.1 hypothetical protein FNC98_10235 [Thalassotalea sp. PS06]